MRSVILGLMIAIFLIPSAHAFVFNGTVLDINGNPLNNSDITITITNFTEGIGTTTAGSNTTTSNATGWFNLSVYEDGIFDYDYDISISHTNETTNSVDWISLTLPAVPNSTFINASGIDFYLRPAGTINITAVNSSSDIQNISYMIKDQKLGYPLKFNLDADETETSFVVSIPRDRNYSIMVVPKFWFPMSFDWNNFSATEDYNINTLSSYNATTNTLHYQFNTSSSLVRATGYIDRTGISGWDEFNIITYNVEPQNYVDATNSELYNISEFNGETDEYNLTSGFYNITLPVAEVETQSLLLFATAKNGSTWYGGFRNLSSPDTSDPVLNFTMYPLSGFEYNISVPSNSGEKNVTTAAHNINFFNSNGSTISGTSIFAEFVMDYTDYSGTGSSDGDIFTWVYRLNGDEDQATMSIPMINDTGIDFIRVYSPGAFGEEEDEANYAPKKLHYEYSNFTTDAGNTNITLNEFSPSDIDGSSLTIKMGLYKSNSTCDVPSPDSSCILFGLDDSDFDNFNPFKLIMGGGRVSVRMGTSDIKVHYVNVDLLASGPPDALFDDSTTTSTSSGFESAMRFGSSGPTIFDYALISMPYTQGSTSQTGLDESSAVYMNVTKLYDDEWETFWDVETNGTNATLLAGNDSYYENDASAWQILLEGTLCHENATSINETNPCYIDKSNNRVWVRIPHFSGTGPEISGTVITKTTTSSSSGGGSSGSSGGAGASTTTNSVKASHTFLETTPGVASIFNLADKDLGVKEITILVNNIANNVKITVEKLEGKPASVTQEVTGKIFKYIEINVENLNDNNIDSAEINFNINSTWINDNNINRSTIKLHRYSGGEWTELVTVCNDIVNNDLECTATTPGFSTFAIAGKEAQTVDTTQTQQETDDIGIVEEFDNSSNNQSQTIYIIVAFVVGIGIVMLATINKFKKDKSHRHSYKRRKTHQKRKRH